VPFVFYRPYGRDRHNRKKANLQRKKSRRMTARLLPCHLPLEFRLHMTKLKFASLGLGRREEVGGRAFVTLLGPDV
jgi:hypothetical protein